MCSSDLKTQQAKGLDITCVKVLYTVITFPLEELPLTNIVTLLIFSKNYLQVLAFPHSN